MTRIAIIGSRRRTDRGTVEACVAELPAGSIVISGGSRGVDCWVADAARRRGLEVIEHRPDLAGARNYGDAAGRYHQRNQRIVDTADRIFAFPAADRTGGTEDTIRRAAKARKPVELR